MPDLPEQLVERILARVPFPYIFKARTLSRSWLARLSPVSLSDDDEEKKRVAISFQSRMALDWSTKWPTLCPVLIGNEFWRESLKEYVIGYDRASRLWKRLPSLSFLPENLLGSYMELHGALLFIFFTRVRTAQRPHIYVANILTRTWKELPQRPPHNDQHLSQRDMCLAHNVMSYAETSHTKTYKIVEFWSKAVRYGQNYYLALMYDFKEDAWTRKMVDIPESYRDYVRVTGRGVHFNGALYWLCGPTTKSKNLLAYNVEEATFQVLQMPAPDTPWQDMYHLVVCSGSLLLVRSYEIRPSSAEWPADRAADNYLDCRSERVVVIKIDLESRSWLELTRGPPSHHQECVIASDGDCVFIVGQFRSYHSSGPKVFEACYEYNVKNDEWSTFPMPDNKFYARGYQTRYSSSFQPGWNPLGAL